MVIADADMDDVKEQYEELMKQSKERFPDTAEFFLHASIIDWLNKEFDPDYQTDLLSTDMTRLNEI